MVAMCLINPFIKSEHFNISTENINIIAEYYRENISANDRINNHEISLVKVAPKLKPCRNVLVIFLWPTY